VTRQDWLKAAGFSFLALAIRLPFASRYLYHWDSVNFALSLSDYNVTLHQPHPPGYILYSLLGRAVNLIFHDPNTSLVAISLAAGALGVGMVYWLGVHLFGPRVGIAAAAMTLLSPLHWFQSEVALSYALEFLLVGLLIGMVHKQLTGEGGSWIASSVLLVIVGGVRQSDLLFMAPVWFYGIAHCGRREQISALVIVSLGVGLWLWPMIAWSGGLSAYISALLAESLGVSAQSSVFSVTELGLNLGRMAIFIFYAILLGLVPLVGAILRSLRDIKLRQQPFVILALWMAPATAFGVLVHIRQSGHVFSFLAGVYLLVGWSIVKLAERLDKSVSLRWSFPGLVLATALPGGLFFMSAPAALFGSSQTVFQTPSRAAIRQQDTRLAEGFTYIRTQFDPQTTVVVAGGMDFRHIDFYLPDYQLTDISYRLADSPVVLPAAVSTLVYFNQEELPEHSPGLTVELHQFPDGTRLWFMHWSSTSTVEVSESGVHLARAQDQP